MSHLEKMFGILIDSGNAPRISLLFQQCLSDIAVVLLVSVATGIMTGALITGILYAAYLGLISYGLANQAAMLTVGVIAVLLIVVLIATLMFWLNKVQQALHRLLHLKAPLISLAQTVADSFLEGFLSPVELPRPQERE
jgi:hypothetical protein